MRKLKKQVDELQILVQDAQEICGGILNKFDAVSEKMEDTIQNLEKEKSLIELLRMERGSL